MILRNIITFWLEIKKTLLFCIMITLIFILLLNHWGVFANMAPYEYDSIDFKVDTNLPVYFTIER